LEKQTFITFLEQFELQERLFDHEERRVLKYNKEHEKMEELAQRLDSFKEGFAASLTNVFGFVCYKNLQHYLEHL